VPLREYADAIAAELAMRHGGNEAWTLDTLYFGGGTPSRLGGEGVARVIDVVAERARIAEGAEVTLETNPEDVSPEAVRGWRAAGVNRVSLGAQSFHDAVLSWMHRVHDSTAIDRAVHTIRDGGIENLSLDLIFALPPSLERDLDRDLDRALALSPEHLSLYGLTVEPHTPLGRWRDRGAVDEAPEERYESEFLRAHDALAAAGFAHYEVSNFAVAGREARHNSAYWTGAPYAGLGPSAHGYDGHERFWNVSAYAEWLHRLQANADPEAGRERLDVEARRAEEVYLGLRTTNGLAMDGADLARTERWISAGWATLVGADRLVLTPRGWLRLDALAADLTVVRSC
jgi:putative oxygen-independent coproporphyrinogen III oxidase